MKLVSQTFRAALDYLTEFGSESDVLLFRPVGDQLILSVNGKAYGEYRCVTDSPLSERFAVPLRIPSRLVKTLDDDLLIEFTVGSHLKMAIGRDVFVSPLAPLSDERTAVSEGLTFEWDASVFVPEIKAASTSAMPGRRDRAMESINIEVLPARETIVASDGSMLTVYETKYNGRNGIRRDDGIEAKALIHKSYVPMVLATCESMGKVKLRFGHNSVAIECGRRTSIVPMQDGAFPMWRESIGELLNQNPIIGRCEIEAASLGRAVRQVKMDAMESEVSGSVRLNCFHSELKLSAKSEAGTDSRAVVPLLRSGPGLPGITLGARYLLSVVKHWPAGVPLVMEYRGPFAPVTFVRPRFRAFLMPMLDPAAIEDEEDEFELVAEVSHG